jgi:hypothetical protein
LTAQVGQFAFQSAQPSIFVVAILEAVSIRAPARAAISARNTVNGHENGERRRERVPVRLLMQAHQ